MAVIFVDYPGFNLRLAHYLRRKQFSGKLIYYISPQVWAWNRGRIPRMAAFLDLMICIFPFEKSLYEASGLRTEFVGHPMIEELDRQRIHEPRVPNLVALLPGSRSREIKRIFPVMLEAAKLLRTKDEAHSFRGVRCFRNRPRIHAETGRRIRLRRDPNRVEEFLRTDAESVRGDGCFRDGDVGIQFLSFAICSNLQGVLVYLLSRAFAHSGRPSGDAEHPGRQRDYPGIHSAEAVPDRIADSVWKLYSDPDRREAMVSEMDRIIKLLGGKGAGRRAAEAVVRELIACLG